MLKQFSICQTPEIETDELVSELQQQRQLKKQPLSAKGHLWKLLTVNQTFLFGLLVSRKYNQNVCMFGHNDHHPCLLKV